MKKLIFTLSLAVACLFNAEAQIQKGNIIAGANLSKFYLGLDDPNAFQLDITPQFAWFVKDGLALGGQVNFGMYTQKDYGEDINYGIAAFGRYYGANAVDVVKKSRFFAEATAGISGFNPSVGDNANGFGFSFGPGYSYFITSNIGLEALLKYHGLVDFDNDPYSNQLTLGIGFSIYLPGKSR